MANTATTRRQGLPARVRAAEVHFGLTAPSQANPEYTKSDRVPLEKRLAALETAATITTLKAQHAISMDRRIDAIEATY
jgi:hypothetical protein